MEQYEKSAPPIAVSETKSTADPADIRRLEKLIADQAQQIQELAKEIRRLKTKLDAHAAVINNSNRG
jgi:septal ring factor EnvC (AmiA/AmiB activator)